MLKRQRASEAARETGGCSEKFKIWNKLCRWIVLDSKIGGSEE